MGGSGFDLPFLSGGSGNLPRYGTGESKLHSAEAREDPKRPGEAERISEAETLFLSLFGIIGESSPGETTFGQSPGDKIHKRRSPPCRKQIHTPLAKSLEANKGAIRQPQEIRWLDFILSCQKLWAGIERTCLGEELEDVGQSEFR